MSGVGFADGVEAGSAFGDSERRSGELLSGVAGAPVLAGEAASVPFVPDSPKPATPAPDRPAPFEPEPELPEDCAGLDGFAGAAGAAGIGGGPVRPAHVSAAASAFF